MKKLLTILTVVATVACSKSEQPVEYGEVALKAEQGSTVFVDTKAATEIGADYKVKITNTTTSSEVKSGTYAEMKGAFTLPVATYKVEAESCTATVAETNNYNWGQPRYAGSANFTVAAGSSQDVTFQCTMANSKVTVTYDATFTSQFSNYSVEAYTSESRKLAFDHTSTIDDPVAYFTPATLNVVITGTNQANSVKTYTKTIALEAKTWHKLTIKASTDQGSGNLTITVDETIATLENEVTVDPYGN